MFFAAVNVVLDVTFLDVSWQEYLSNVVSFKLDVKNLVCSRLFYCIPRLIFSFSFLVVSLKTFLCVLDTVCVFIIFTRSTFLIVQVSIKYG